MGNSYGSFSFHKLISIPAVFILSHAMGQDSNLVIQRWDFRSLHPPGTKVFYKDTFTSDHTDFTSGTFIRNVDFSSCLFKGNAHFVFDQFDDYVDFTDVVFGHKAYFCSMGLNENSYFDFSRCKLPDTLDFSYNNIVLREIDLSVAKSPELPQKKCAIFLFKSDVSKFRFDYQYFDLLFTDPKYPYKSLSNDERAALYESLLKNFNDRGQKESYKLLDIEYQKFKWRHSAFPGLVFLPKYWWNFGYGKGYVFLWALFFPLLFTLVAFFYLEYLNSVYEIYVGENQNRIPPLSGARLTVLKSYKRLWYAFLYTNILFFSISLKLENIRTFKFWGGIIIMTIYIIGLICVAYMANFVLQH